MAIGSYGKMVLDRTAQVRVAVCKNETYTIGRKDGATWDEIDHAYKVFNGLVALATSVVNAEFPAWHIFRAFSVFSLASSLHPNEIQTKLRRLALAFHLNESDLSEEHQRILPHALARHRMHPELPNASHWIPCVQDVPNTPNLKALILRLTTFSGCTTSGVEHVHIKHEWLLTKRRSTLNTASENDEIKITSDLREEEKGRIIQIARELWHKLYSGFRCCRGKKIQPRKGPTGRLTMRNIKLRRDRAVQMEMRCHTANPAMHLRAMQNAQEIWEPAMTRELDFQNMKKLSSKMDYIDASLLIESDIDTGDQELANRRLTHKIGLRASRLRAAEKKMYALQSRHLALQTGSKIFIHCSAPLSGIRPSPGEFCDIHGFELVSQDEIVHADVVVIATPSSMPLPIHWALFLSGGIACNHRELIGVAGGVNITYKAAVAVGDRRLIWISDKFSVEHGDLNAILVKALALPTCIWKQVGKAEFAAACVRNDMLCVRSRRPLQQIGLVADSQAGGAGGRSNIFSAESLLAKFISIDALVGSGACGS